MSEREADGSEGAWEPGLVRGLRRGEAGAFETLTARYLPLLETYGRRLGLFADEARELAVDALADVAVELAAARRARPGEIARRAGALFRERAYAEKAARQRQLDSARDARLYVERARPVGAVPGTCSEASARDARGADWDAPRLAPGLERLAHALDARLTSDERLLLAWVSEHVPQRVIAEWLGVGHAAARKRLSRLRERLAEAADALARDLPDDERRDVARLLGRPHPDPVERAMADA